jgi:hypothetical protein
VAAEFQTLVTTIDNTNNNAVPPMASVAYAPTFVCSKKSLLALSYSATPEQSFSPLPGNIWQP